MSAFKKPLPLKIFAAENEKREMYLSCFFESMESHSMRLKLKDRKNTFELGSDLSIEFIVAGDKYQFDSALLSDGQDGFLQVRKPKVIYKRSL